MRRTTALIGGLLVAAAAGTLILVLGQGPPPPAGTGTRGDPTSSETAAEGGFDSGNERALTAAAAGERTAAPAESGGGERWAESLTGFRGRIVTAGGAPVPACRVRVYRVAPDVVLQDGVRLMASARVEPRIEAARDETDTDGRFFLDGVFPHGLYALRADFARPEEVPMATLMGHATYRIVQRTPEPGEVVDLGDIPLKEGAVLTGHVVDDDGRPVAGALVRAVQVPGAPFRLVPLERLQPDGGLLVRAGGIELALLFPPWMESIFESLPIARTETGADGAFRLFGVDPGENVFAVTAPRLDSHLDPRIRLTAGEVRNLGEIVLGEGETASVRVMTSSDRPVAGAEVLVAPVSTGPPAHIAQRAGVTDAEGMLEIPGLPRGRVIAAVRRTPLDPWIVGEPQPVDREVRFVLGDTFALTVTVLAPDGSVFGRPRLRILGGGQEPALASSLFGLLDPLPLEGRLERLEDGRLRVTDLPAASYLVMADGPGFAVTVEEVDLRGDTERTIRLRPSVDLTVRVRDHLGAPVEDASVYVQPRGGDRSQRMANALFHAGLTDGDGTVSVKMPTDRARLTASHPAHGNTHRQLDTPASAVELVFGQPGAIEGLLTDGGRPPQPGRWLLVLERRRNGGDRGAIPDLPKLTVPDLSGGFAFHGLQPGRYRITAQDSMDEVATLGSALQFAMRRRAIYPWARQEVDVVAGGTATVRFDALLDAEPYTGPGAEVSGTVLLNGIPAAGAVVGAHSHATDRDAVSRVDSAGRFELGLVPAGSTRVTVLPKSVAESRRREDIFNHYWARDVEVVDGQPVFLSIEVQTGALTGFVHDHRGAPVEGARVRAIGEQRESISGGLLSAVTDARGRFVFDDLPEGSVRLGARKSGVGEAELGGVRVTAGLPAGPVELRMTPLVQVRGRLTLPDGQTARGARVELRAVEGRGRHGAGSRRNGVFRVRDVRPGSYTLVVLRPNVPPWTRPQPLQVGERDIEGLELQLPQ